MFNVLHKIYIFNTEFVEVEVIGFISFVYNYVNEEYLCPP